MPTYNRRYQELSLLCPHMVKNEALKIERYTDGSPLATRNDVIAARPANLHEAISIAQSLMDFIVLDNVAKGKKDKRKRNDHAREMTSPTNGKRLPRYMQLVMERRRATTGTNRCVNDATEITMDDVLWCAKIAPSQGILLRIVGPNLLPWCKPHREMVGRQRSPALDAVRRDTTETNP